MGLFSKKPNEKSTHKENRGKEAKKLWKKHSSKQRKKRFNGFEGVQAVLTFSNLDENFNYDFNNLVGFQGATFQN